MYLTQLEIRRVRNLEAVKINPAPGLNLIFGQNASGKTSLLEAIHFLSHGRSFRTANIQTVISHRHDNLQVVGQVFHPGLKQQSSLGIERGQKLCRIRINQESVNQTSKLAAYLPVQIINPESHQLIEQGPSQRRKFLDWGLFHVEHQFHTIWQQYNRVLKQRNASLRQGGSISSIQLWDKPLIEYGMKLDAFRRQYLQDLTSYINTSIETLLGFSVQTSYQAGWNKELAFDQALAANIESDRQQGFTRTGPHRAELRITAEAHPVKDQFSRGQQKLLVCALRIAQITHLKEKLGQISVMLVDDLAAELDQHRRQHLLRLLHSTQAQVFITVTEASLVEHSGWESYKMFHVEHGKVSEVV